MNIQSANDFPKPGLYRHYKGNLYRLLFLATHSETEETLVIYRALYGEQAVWARPLSMWNENVLVNGQPIPRFTFVSEE